MPSTRLLKYCTLLLLLLFHITSVGQSEILKIYDSSNPTINQSTNASLLVQRFDLPHPGKVHKVEFLTAGAAGSSIDVSLFGHEGGTAFPQFEKELVPFETVTKSTSSEEKLSVTFDPPIYLDNNQFFIAFKNSSRGLILKAESKSAVATCKSGSGGDYYSLYLKAGNSWSIRSVNSYILDVTIEYDHMPDNPLMEDVTHSLGIDTLLSNSTMAWADLNNDNLPELLVSGQLYLNNETVFQNITSNSRLKGRPRANALVDMDNDGDLDIIFIDAADTSSIFENKGDLIFVQHILEGLPDFNAITSLSFSDVNSDGLPDMFIGQIWGPYPVPQPNYLYLNKGSWTVEDITTKLYPENTPGLNFPNNTPCTESNSNSWLPNQNRNKRSRGSAFVDFNEDGFQDLYITNYFLESDELYQNDNGVYKNVAVSKGISSNTTGFNHGTGVDWGDYDNDGDMDLLLPQFSHPGFATQYDHRSLALYRNEGAPDYSFTDTRNSNGIQFEETYAGGTWGDVNNDGLLDFYVTVFYGCRYVKMYIQQSDHSFKLMTQHYGLDKINTGTDAVWVDYNGDGLLDLCSGKGNRIRLYKNNSISQNNFVKLKLRSSSANSHAIATRVTAYYGGIKSSQEIQAGRGQKMQKPYTLHFGIGKYSRVDSFVVRWPDQSKSIITNVAANSTAEMSSQTQPSQIKVVLMPNPVKMDAKFSISMNEDSHVQIELFDISGKIITRLYNGNLTKGNHAVHWNTSSVENGIYFYKVVSKGTEKTGKIVLTR
jgi:hypothetical protein